MSELTLVTVGYSISMLVTIGFGFFVLFQNVKGGVHRVFFSCVFLLPVPAFLRVGANTADPPRVFVLVREHRRHLPRLFLFALHNPRT